MLIYREGTVFNTPAKTIVNTVNCLGVMGTGIALEFKLRYPEMYEQYVDCCNNKKYKVGIPKIYEYSEKVWIMNFPTKINWKYPSKIEWIEGGLKYFAENYKKRNIESIAFPKLGTSNGGLNWNEVKLLMEKYLLNLDIDVYVCLDEKIEAEGIEKEMLCRLKDLSIDILINKAKISKKQSEIIISNANVSRLWNISNLDGIGIKTYEKLFSYLYNDLNVKGINSKNKSVSGEQLSLF